MIDYDWSADYDPTDAIADAYEWDQAALANELDTHEWDDLPDGIEPDTHDENA
jgi:hypothetical protein